MDVLLTEQERMFRQQMRDFVESEITPCADEWDRRNAARLRSIQEDGVGGAHRPHDPRGVRRTRRVPHGLVSHVSGTCARKHIGGLDHRHAPRTRAERPVPLRQRGYQSADTWCLRPRARSSAPSGSTEREASSDVSGMSTTARREGDEWVLNGGKCFISNGDTADIILTFATVDRSLGARGITAFVVEKTMPGFSVGKVEDKLGIRAESVSELVFDDVRVPAANLVGEVGKGMRIALATLDEGRLDVAGQGVGVASAALDAAIAYSKQRKQFGQTISEFQGIQWMLVDMANEVDAAWLMAYRAARLADSGAAFHQGSGPGKTVTLLTPRWT